MSKKIISLLLTVCILFCLSACGATETSGNVNNTPSESQTDTTQDTDENTLRAENSEVSSNTEEINENDTTQTQTQTNQSKPTSVTNQPTHTHSYSNATCTSPKKCSCGATSGNALGHSYSNANCTTPKKCTRCGMTAGTALGHQFSSATCTNPQICSRCGTTSGNALGHSYSAANCNSPKTCTRCGQTEGSALGHNYINNKCSRCGKVDPDSLPVELSELYLMDSSYYRYRNSRFTDSFGNTYNGAHAFYQSYFCFDGSAKEPHSIFSLNGKYSYFKGSIVATTEPSEGDTYYINIYVDDVLKFSKIGYSKTTGKIDFKVDVKNGQSLKIVVGIEQKHRYNYNDEIALVDAQLTK